MRNYLGAFAFVGLSMSLSGQGGELAPLRDTLDRITAELGVRGAGLVVVRDDEELHRSLHRGLTGDEVLPIASASKWLAVATILTLVDEGVLDLDAAVARYVSEFDRDDKRMLTVRQCLACTGGVGARLPGGVRGFDMTRFAAAAADAALREHPGSTFRYGGVGFQIAAVAAERASGKRWHDLFRERIASPLGLVNTGFGMLSPVGGEAGTAALPWVAGGAVSTLDDYARFLRMLVAKGVFAGRRVLSEESIGAMWRDQVAPFVEVHPVGFAAERVRYGLGTWIETLADGGGRVSDPGAFGFTPWIDLDLGVGGVFAVRDRMGRVLPHLRRVQDQVRTLVQSPAIAGTEATIVLAHGGIDRRYALHVPPHQATTAALPLLVVLHGGGSNHADMRAMTGLADLGVRAGFVVVFPDGTGPVRGRLLTWNSGGIAVYAAEHDIDDVGFLRAVVQDVQSRVPIDAARVWATGHSNGAMMCHRLAREAADVFGGIAPVAGAMNWTEASPAGPIAVLIVHGSNDEHVPYEGGAPRASVGRAGERRDASVADAVDYYVERNGLSGYAQMVHEGKVRSETYSVAKGGGAGVPVRVLTLEGGGHSWPGSSHQARRVADTPFPFDASLEIVRFFAGLPGGNGTPVPR